MKRFLHLCQFPPDQRKRSCSNMRPHGTWDRSFPASWDQCRLTRREKGHHVGLRGGLKVLDAPVLFLNQCAEFRMARRTGVMLFEGWLKVEGFSFFLFHVFSFKIKLMYSVLSRHAAGFCYQQDVCFAERHINKSVYEFDKHEQHKCAAPFCDVSTNGGLAGTKIIT